MRGKKHSYSKNSRIGKTRIKIKCSPERIKRIPPRETPDRERVCIDFLKNNCIFYSGKELKNKCPDGKGYLRDKNQNPNNWPTCDGWRPYNSLEKNLNQQYL